MDKQSLKKSFNAAKGFSLLEVLLGITVFMIGMLGVTALNISSLKSNTFSGNMSEAVVIGGDRLEQLMAMKFADVKDTDGDGTGEDADDNGQDDDGGNFGLDDTGCPALPSTDYADDCETGVGKNGIYDVYWNVAFDEPLPEKTKRVNVIVEWNIKGVKRRANMSTIIYDHD